MKNIDDSVELLKDTLNYFMKLGIKDSEKTISFYEKRIEMYQMLIRHLEENKPYFFQKKKLIEYNEKKKEYIEKIEEINNEILDEIKLIDKLNEHCD